MVRAFLAALAAVLLFSAGGLAQAPPVSIYSGRLHALGYCQLTVNTSTQLSACSGGIPTGATVAVMMVETQAVRYRTDGAAPTSTVGMPVAVGTGVVSPLRVAA